MTRIGFSPAATAPRGSYGDAHVDTNAGPLCACPEASMRSMPARSLAPTVPAAIGVETSQAQGRLLVPHSALRTPHSYLASPIPLPVAEALRLRIALALHATEIQLAGRLAERGQAVADQTMRAGE